ncbi:MAG: caspase family protein [bacterium]
MTAYSSCKAMVIGVGRHADPRHDLSYARSDAEAMANMLGDEFGFDQVWTLYDNDATRQNVIRFFERDLQRTEEDDGLLIFFAGHGITVPSAIGDDRGFLVPHDGDPKERYANISLASIRDDYLPNIPAKHVFLIIDACYGGLALRDVGTAELPSSIDEQVLSELTRRDRKVRQVLAAGTKEQRVLDGGLFGHSVFTGRLIEALREATPYITADHVGVHVRERVAQDSLDRKHRQTPQFGYLLGREGSFVFQRGMSVRAQPARPVNITTARRHKAGHPSPAPAPGQMHHLAVTSQPEGAEIVLEGQCRGRTPRSVLLPAGRHVLSLVKEGFEPWRKPIRMRDKGGHLHVQLERACRQCGKLFKPTGDTKLCPRCAAENAQSSRKSIESGNRGLLPAQPPPPLPRSDPPVYPAEVVSDKSRLVAALLGFFLGAFGVHNFYLGYTGRAIAQLLLTLLTCGYGAGITVLWSIIEAILLLTGGIKKDGKGRVLQ